MLDNSSPAAKRLLQIQKFISALEYNHTGQNFFVMKKDRGIKHVCTVAKEIIRESLPIQCVEGVFLGIYSTMGMHDLVRMPVSFKSNVDGNIYRHIILAINSTETGKWGAVGISRRRSLMFKDIKFDSLADLMKEFKDSYESNFHKLVKIYIGLPFGHDLHSSMKLQWKVFKIKIVNKEWRNEVAEHINKYAKDAASYFEYFAYTGQLPPAAFGPDHESSLADGGVVPLERLKAGDTTTAIRRGGGPTTSINRKVDSSPIRKKRNPKADSSDEDDEH